MSESQPTHLSRDDLLAEEGTALPAKEVLSLLDLNVDLDLALDLAAPIDLAVAANANIAAPIDAAVSANVLSAFSNAAGMADQDVAIEQVLTGDANAHAPQTSVLDQSDDVVEPAPAPAETTDPGAVDAALDPADLLDGDLLNVNVDLALDADIAAPIAGAVALNANVAAPIDAAVAANVASINSEAVAVADQDALIVQHLDGNAEAVAEQDSTITQ
jgi:hypothetical protein